MNAVMLLSNLYLSSNKNTDETKSNIAKIILDASPESFQEEGTVQGMPLESALLNNAFESLSALYDAGFTFPLNQRNRETMGRLMAQGNHKNTQLMINLFPECFLDKVSIQSFATYWRWDNNLSVSYIKELLDLPCDTVLLSNVMSSLLAQVSNHTLTNMEQQEHAIEKLSLLLKKGWLSEADIDHWTEDKEFRPRILKLVAKSIELLLDTDTLSAEGITKKIIRL